MPQKKQARSAVEVGGCAEDGETSPSGTGGGVGDGAGGGGEAGDERAGLGVGAFGEDSEGGTVTGNEKAQVGNAWGSGNSGCR